MNLDELEALAKAVPKDICFQNIHHLKAFNAAATPETILAMIALLREMGDFLDTLDFADDDTEQQQLLAKYKEMTK